MTLTKQIVIDRIEILEDGQLQVRQATRILEDGKVISKTFHRHVVAPGDDVKSEDARVKKVAGVLHDKATIDAYKDKQKGLN
jgi:hypothetical protein